MSAVTFTAERTRDDAIRAALFAHDGMETLIREKRLPREAVAPEPVGFLAALEGIGWTVVPFGTSRERELRRDLVATAQQRNDAQAALRDIWDERDHHRPDCPMWFAVSDPDPKCQCCLAAHIDTMAWRTL